MKKSLIIALALMLVLAFASSAMAAQSFVPSSTGGLIEHDYLSTTATGMSRTGDSTGSAFSRTYQSSKFTVDGYTYYPYEIYLPNEARPDNYRIHSNYAKNTDACASCHSTHTAVGNTLLQWYSTYETCMACHDGTVTTTYDVASGKIGTSGKAAMGGAFNGTGQNASNHNVTGSMSIAAAPGGSAIPKTVELKSVGATQQSQWSPAFGCESCHTPHGAGGNARILNPDPNFVASAAKPASGYAVVLGHVYAISDTGYANPLYILNQYPYSVSFKNASADATATIDNSDGYSTVDGTVDVVYGTAALQVKMDIDHYLGFDGFESVKHISGMNTFCGACHTDYNTAGITNPSDKESGTYSNAHRHAVGVLPTYNTPTNLADASMVLESGNLECLTCHVAHGVSDQYWINTIGSASNTVGYLTTPYLADNKLEELAGSSALKRIPNMGTCEACHQKGAANQGYDVNSGTDASGEDAIATGLMPNTYNFNANTFYTVDIAKTDLGWVGSDKCLGCHEEYVKGWKKTGHATSGHDASGLASGGCAACHNPGGNLMWTGVFNPVTGNGYDDAITCEACHGTGKNHIAAPSSKNIFNPGTTDILRQTIECGRCHDMYANKPTNLTGSVALGNIIGAVYETSGSASVKAGVYTTQAMYDLAKAGKWSPAFKVAKDDPAKFANASQLKTTSTHFGGSWGYADSKHFLGTNNDIKNPNGVVSCNTCHDMHSDKNPGALKYSYEQVCESCHDASANLAIAVAMPNNSWARHQLEANDFAHSFKFGAPAAIKSAKLQSVNVENAGSSTGITVFVESLTDRTGNKDFDLFQGPVGDRGGAVGFKLSVYDGLNATGTQLFNNYAGTYELTPPVGTAAVEGDDYELTESGVVEFFNNTNTFDTGRLAGVWTVKWTSAVDSTITATDSFTITH